VGDEKEEREVAGDAKTRLDAIVEAEDEWGDAVAEAACARRVSRARMPEEERAGTMVHADADDDRDDPRDRGPDREREERRERENCGDLPTKPGPFGETNSKVGVKASMPPGANEYSEPG
jgi:hypothetical protein